MTATAVPRRAAVFWLLLALSTGAWGQGSHPGTAVRVNGVDISNERFNAFYQEYRRPYGINVAGRGDYLQRSAPHDNGRRLIETSVSDVIFRAIVTNGVVGHQPMGRE